MFEKNCRETFTLTTNTDAVPGTAGNDTITGSASTFNSDDTINGGDGTDTFSVTVAAAGTVIGNLTSVETVRVTNGGAATDNYAINMIGATGATELVSRLSSGDVSFSNVQAAAKLTAYGTVAVTSQLSATFLNSLASGTADSVSLKADGGAAVTFEASGTTTTNVFETVNLESAGGIKNTVEFGTTLAGGAKAVNVTGAADLTIALSGGATGASYDGSAATGAQTVTVAAAAKYATIKGGTGADVFDVSGLTFFGNTAAKTVVGGDGADKLVVNENFTSTTSATAGVAHAISGVETVEFQAKLADSANTGTNLARNVDASKIAGETTILITGENNELTAGANNDVVVTISGLTTETVDFSFQASTAASNDGNISVAMKDDTGAADSVTVRSVGVTGQVNNLTTLTVAQLANNAANAVETVNIVAAASDVTTTVGTTIGTVSAGASNTLAISGSKNIAIGAVDLAAATATRNQLIDASALTGKLTLGSSGVAGVEADSVTVIGGSGNDSLYFGTTLSTKDSIDGGNGTDTLYVSDSATAGVLEAAKIANVEWFQIDTANGGAKTFSVKNADAATKVQIVDTANSAGYGTTVSNINGQTVSIVTNDDQTDTNFAAANITLKAATGASGVNVSLDNATTALGVANGVAFAGAITVEGVASVTVTDAVKNGASGYFTAAQQVTVAGAGTTAVPALTSVTLAGGGKASATANSVFTLSGTSNVSLSTIDATALSSDLVVAATTAAGASIKLGAGDNKVTLDLADLGRDEVVVNGGDGIDTLVAVNLASAVYRPGATQVENISVDLDGTMTAAGELSLLDASSVVKVSIDLDGAGGGFGVTGASNVANYALQDQFGASKTLTLSSATAVTVVNAAALGNTLTNVVLSDATAVTIKQGSSSNTLLGSVAAAKATSLTVGGADKDATSGVEYSGSIDIRSATSLTALTSLTLNSSDGAISFGTEELTAAKLATVTVTGDNNVTLGGTTASTAALASVDASALTGDLTIGRGVDFTTSATITGGSGNDTIWMNIQDFGGVAVDAGSQATNGADTLKLQGTMSLGLTVIDLSSATDQLTQANGSVNGAVQKGFESVDLSALAGSFGANITGSSGANTIVGTGRADNIVAGGGADRITGGAGDDTINLSNGSSTASTDLVDTVVFSAFASNGTDNISGFTAGSGGDILEVVGVDTGFNATLKVATLSANGATLTSLSGTATASDVDVIVLLDTGLASAADALTELDGTATAITDSDGAIVVFYNTTSGAVEVYHNSDESPAAGTMTLLATLSDLGASSIANFSGVNFA